MPLTQENRRFRTWHLSCILFSSTRGDRRHVIEPTRTSGENPTMLSKILSLGLTSLLGLALAAAFPPEPPDDGPPPPPKGKKKDDRGPDDGLRKAYDLLRRIRSDDRTTGKPEHRLRDWTDRAAEIYRDGVKAHKNGDGRAAHEYGLAAHDLARAVDHARNAAMFDRSEVDPDLPPPPGPGPGADDERVSRDLRRAYDRIREQLDENDRGKDARFYNDAARDLYNAARRDAEANRNERAGELARAAEAMSHVNEHLARANDDDDRPEPKAGRPEPKRKPEPKEKKGERPEKKKRPEPKDERPEPKDSDRGDALPPPL
jgi:hypothetical protein